MENIKCYDIIKNIERIIFVGVHYKENTDALCSSTFTGKIIDSIIDQLPPNTCIKTNLFNSTYIPKGEEKKRMVRDFIENMNFTENDIIVCLGSIVFDIIGLYPNGYKIKLMHPSGIRYAGISKEDYILNSASLILKSNAL